jgi:hypothetical protein
MTAVAVRPWDRSTNDTRRPQLPESLRHLRWTRWGGMGGTGRAWDGSKRTGLDTIGRDTNLEEHGSSSSLAQSEVMRSNHATSSGGDSPRGWSKRGRRVA